MGQGQWDSKDVHIGGVPGIAWRASATFPGGEGSLKVSPTSGSSPSDIAIVVDAAGLQPGSYQGTITIVAPAAIPPSISIEVSIQVNSPPVSAWRVTNLAVETTPYNSASGVAQGSVILIDGYNIGPGTPPLGDFFNYLLGHASAFPLATTFQGTSVQVKASGRTYDAPVLYSSYTSVAAIVPSLVPVGDAQLVVTYKGVSSDPLPVQVVKSALGIFSLSGYGAGPGIITGSDQAILTFAQPAHSGDVVRLRGTGLGAVATDEAAAPAPGNLFKSEVFVGNRAAVVQYAGRSECCAGLDEIVFEIPAGVNGCFVPVAVRTAGSVSNFVSMPVAPPGEPCSDPIGLPPDLVAKAATGDNIAVGGIALGPVPALEAAGFSFVKALADRLSAALRTPVTDQELLELVRVARHRRGRAFQSVMKKYGPILKARHLDPESLFRITSMVNAPGYGAIF
jgi:uncharacterized protein (TIGR03437 family)